MLWLFMVAVYFMAFGLPGNFTQPGQGYFTSTAGSTDVTISKHESSSNETHYVIVSLCHKLIKRLIGDVYLRSERRRKLDHAWLPRDCMVPDNTIPIEYFGVLVEVGPH